MLPKQNADQKVENFLGLKKFPNHPQGVFHFHAVFTFHSFQVVTTAATYFEKERGIQRTDLFGVLTHHVIKGILIFNLHFKKMQMWVPVLLLVK